MAQKIWRFQSEGPHLITRKAFGASWGSTGGGFASYDVPFQVTVPTGLLGKRVGVVVSAQFGGVTITTATKPDDVSMEVGFGWSSAGSSGELTHDNSPVKRSLYPMNTAHMKSMSEVGHPYFANHFYTHDASRPYLNVFARVNTGGSQMVNASFKVSIITVLLFDLTYGVDDYFTDEIPGVGLGPYSMPHLLPSFVHRQTAVPWNGQSRQWLVFASANCAPGYNLSAYHCDITIGNLTPGVTRLLRWGSRSRHASKTIARARHRDQFGGFAVVECTGPGQFITLTMMSVWDQLLHADKAEIANYTVFAVPLDLWQAASTIHDVFHNAHQNFYGPQPNGGSGSRSATLLIDPPVDSDLRDYGYLMGAQAQAGLETGSKFGMIEILHNGRRISANGQQAKQQQFAVYAERIGVISRLEGAEHIPIQTFTNVIALSSNTITVRGVNAQNDQSSRAGRDIAYFGLYLDQDPPGTTPVKAQPGPKVAISIQGEAPDLVALSEPPHTPDLTAAYELTGVEMIEFPTELGRMRTWPKFLVPRYKVSMPWTSIDTSKLDALLSFFDALDRSAFKITIQGEDSPRAFLIHGEYEIIESGFREDGELLWDLTVPCIEAKALGDTP